MASFIVIFFSFLLLLCLGIVTIVFFFFWDARRGTPGLRVIRNTLGRDLKAGYLFMKVRAFVSSCHQQNCTVASLFQKVVKNNPQKTCFLYEDQEWTYQQVEEYSNQVANYFYAEGFQKGDEIALFMQNRPHYVCIWLGLSKIGVIPAFINTNLLSHSLANSINVINCKAIIYGTELSAVVKEVIPLLEKKETIKLYSSGNDVIPFDLPVKSLDNVLLEVSSKPPDVGNQRANFNDKLLYIYTSGTTGLPKAAIIRHSRFIWVAAASKNVIGLYDSDVFYSPLPMYHSSGGLVCLSFLLIFGGTMAIRKKFSASNFWLDAIKYRATVSQYIGETCRYLLAQPKKPQDTEHKIRVMTGNGLRPRIWEEFVERFKVDKIVEFYGSTEGNANVVNTTGRVGAVGFISRLFGRIYPVSLIKVDLETGELIRGRNGLCVHCKPGEPGEMVGRIIKTVPWCSFDGYANPEATRKKIVKNCFSHGDLAFTSGDVLVMDEDGYLYFLDRSGDTFRWRGENVSTGEVESVISKVLGLADCVVYGVEVPGVEGRAGMAAIHTSTENFDLQSFHSDISKVLPSYAIPVFVRICADIEKTGTFKFRKMNLQKDGFDPTKIKDPLFFLNLKSHSYVSLDEKNYNLIINGSIRM